MRDIFEMIQRMPNTESGGSNLFEDINIWKTKTLYERLNVSENASESEIKKAYIRMLKKYHIDNTYQYKNPKLTENYEAICQLLADAQDWLVNYKKRSAYDDFLKNQRAKANKQNSNQNNKQKNHFNSDNNQNAHNSGNSQSNKNYGHDNRNQTNQQGRADSNEANSAQLKEIADFQKMFLETNFRYDLWKVVTKIEFLTRSKNISKESLLFGVEKQILNKLNHYISVQNGQDIYYDIEGIINMFKQLVDIGIPLSKIINSTSSILAQKFGDFAVINVSYHALDSVLLFANHLNGLGVDKKILISPTIEDVFLNDLKKFITENKNYGMENIRNYFNKLTELGIDKSRLNDLRKGL